MVTRDRVLWAVSLAVAVVVSACASSSTLLLRTPRNQKTLRTEASEFNETMAVPAVIGAVGGAVLGGLLRGEKLEGLCRGRCSSGRTDRWRGGLPRGGAKREVREP